jgi:uncharacterized RDD family membrane protein YckC
MSPGWYHDPAPANPATPGTMRFWDGRQWTAQVRAAKRSEIAEMRQALAVKRAEQSQLAYAGGGYATADGAATAMAYGFTQLSSRDVTPDGEVLAGWWARAGAFVLDYLLRGVIVTALGWTFMLRIAHGFRDLVDQAAQSASTGGTTSSAELDHQLLSAVMPSVIALALVAVGVQLLYGVVFLKAFAATPGKMVVGLKVRLRDRPGPLPWGTVLVRCLVQNLALFLALVPVVNLFSSLYSLLNSLWPAWDGRRQGLHDKAARTNVVRVR